MKQNFRLTAPEILGLCVVGATVGAVLSALSMPDRIIVALGALGGAWLLPTILLADWARLLRQGARPLPARSV